MVFLVYKNLETSNEKTLKAFKLFNRKLKKKIIYFNHSKYKKVSYKKIAFKNTKQNLKFLN